MNEDALNTSVRKFLKEVGVTSQREIERVVRDGAAKGSTLRLRMTLTSEPAKAIDPHALRSDFPILRTTVHGKPLIYLDSASTSQKPQVVIDAVDEFYREYNANVHRGIYEIGERSTAAYEKSRAQIARFIGASDAPS